MMEEELSAFMEDHEVEDLTLNLLQHSEKPVRQDDIDKFIRWGERTVLAYEVFSGLVNGLYACTGINPKGEPTFALTEEGKEMAAWRKQAKEAIKKRHKKDRSKYDGKGKRRK